MIYCKHCSQSPIYWSQEVNRFNRNDLKATIHTSYIDNTEHPDRFTITALGSPLGTVNKHCKTCDIIANLSKCLTDV